jgi:SET domain-containing protein
MSKVYVGNAEGKGRGVFAAEKILTGETIELSHVVEFPKEEW